MAGSGLRKLVLTLLLVGLSQCYTCEYITTTGVYFSYSCTWGCYDTLTPYQVSIQDCPGVQWWQVLLMILLGLAIVGGIAFFIQKRRQRAGPASAPLNY